MYSKFVTVMGKSKSLLHLYSSLHIPAATAAVSIAVLLRWVFGMYILAVGIVQLLLGAVLVVLALKVAAVCEPGVLLQLLML